LGYIPQGLISELIRKLAETMWAGLTSWALPTMWCIPSWEPGGCSPDMETILHESANQLLPIKLQRKY